jgi:hypothetical protein
MSSRNLRVVKVLLKTGRSYAEAATLRRVTNEIETYRRLLRFGKQYCGRKTVWKHNA